MPRTPVSAFLCLVCLLVMGSAQGDWLDPAWPQRLALSAQPALIEDGEIFSDFTLHVRLDGIQHPQLFASARSDAADLVFTAADGTTVLGHEVVHYDAVAEQAELWFKAPQFSDADNLFYLYFGNPAAATPPAAGAAWSAGHLGVFHFDADPTLGVLADSSPNGNHANTGSGAGWASDDLVDAAVGKGWNFNGVNTFVNADAVQSSNQTHTFSAWFALSNLADDANFAFSAEVGFWHLSAKRNGGQRYADLVTSHGYFRWNPQITDNELHHYVWVLDAVADTARFYFDGVEQSFNIRYPASSPHIYTGETIQGQVAIAGPLFEGNPYDLMEGITDEFWIYEGVRSSAWIKTQYNNMAQAGTFFSSSLEDYQPTAVDPLLPLLARLQVWPNPFSSRAEIRVEANGAKLEIAIYDLAGRRVRTLQSPSPTRGAIHLIWDGRNDHGVEVSAGTYFVRAASAGAATSAKVLIVR